MVKVDTEFKLFHPMVKYNHLFNDLFFAPGISGSMIEFIGDCPFEVRPWVLKLTHDKPWAWTEAKFWNNSI